MTLAQTLQTLDERKPNDLTEAQKLRWLGFAELELIDRVFQDGRSFTPYTELTDPQTQLLLPDPYSEAYLHWLAAQIDLWNRELQGYGGHITLFNQLVRLFAAHHQRQSPKHHGGFTQ